MDFIGFQENIKQSNRLFSGTDMQFVLKRIAL